MKVFYKFFVKKEFSLASDQQAVLYNKHGNKNIANRKTSNKTAVSQNKLCFDAEINPHNIKMITFKNSSNNTQNNARADSPFVRIKFRPVLLCQALDSRHKIYSMV